MNKKIIITLLIGLMLWNCNELTLNPLSEGSTQNWYSDDTEISMALNKLYDLNYYENFFVSGVFWLDWWTESWTDNQGIRFTPGSFVAGTLDGQNVMLNKLWDRAYQCINNANTLLENIDKVKNEISEQQLNRFIADARFARAIQYSFLIFYWGDVPFYTNILDIEEAFSLSRTNKEIILSEIYEDFDFAISWSPLSYSGNDYRRATKGAALAMKARIALYMEDWEIARDAAKECIELGVYELYPDFHELFGQKYTSEFIFSAPRSVDYNSYVNIEQLGTRNTGGYATVQPTWDLLASFLCTDGLPIDESPLFNPQDPFRNRDPRCAMTIVEFGTSHLGVIYEPHPDTLKVFNFRTGSYMDNQDSRGVNQYASYNGLAWKKWLKDGWYTGNRGSMTNIVIRYADVLLMYAEAKIELNEIDQSALDAINTVRARAYGAEVNEISLYPEVTTISQSELRRIVRTERRMEFAMEGRRLPDILRWRIAEKVLNKKNYGMLDPVDLREKVIPQGLWFWPETPSIDEDGIADFDALYEKGFCKLLSERVFDATKSYLFPIPTSEILINDNLEQNPNY